MHPKRNRFYDFGKSVLNWFVHFIRKIAFGFLGFFKQTGIAIAHVFINLYKLVKNFFINTYKHFVYGGWRTKVTHFIMGSGHMLLARPIKGLIYLVTQVGYFIYMFLPKGGIYWLTKFQTLGTVAVEYTAECTQIPPVPIEQCDPDFITYSKPVYKDNSMLIMLFGVATIIITILFLVLFFMQARGTYKAEQMYNAAKTKHKNELTLDENGNLMAKTAFKNPLPTFGDELKSLLNSRFQFTTLAIPTLTISVFTVLPLVFMILLAFTNFNRDFGPPNKLFSWVGLDTFKNLFSSSGTNTFGQALGAIIQWTFIWAFFATFTNYIFGLILAMIINRRSIKAKKVWRTLFVVSIAVPQFVTLLLMSQLLKDNGPLNHTLINLGIINRPIKFLTDPTLAKVTVILVNIWVGVPYTMLITSGILMNIPSDLYESARIDGAGPVRQFTKITLPYMLFVTGPYLITQFIGNINNFNVIFFLTQGGPSTGQYGQATYGHTDILITWLFSLTVGGDRNEYAIGSALGIFIFLISATITLVLYSRTAASQNEGDFA